MLGSLLDLQADLQVDLQNVQREIRALLLLVFTARDVLGTKHLDRNLVYRSPFADIPEGDPFDTSVLFWTAHSQVSQLRFLQNIHIPNPRRKACDTGEAFTTYDVDFTLKVEAKGLKADTKYFFQFADCTNPKTVSPIGTTRTLANPNTPARQVNGGKPLTLAVFPAQCWFNAYGVAARNTTADVFIHLGDYMYETIPGGAAIGRTVAGRELATIADYRQRLGLYRMDNDLRFAHEHAPWITVWLQIMGGKLALDSNDTAAGCTFSPSGACFTDRKLAATRAYHEWMPIRQVDTGDKLRIWRNFQIGKLLDLTMLDTRNYDRDITDSIVVASLAGIDDRSLMGALQEQSVKLRYFRAFDTLSQSQRRGAVWRVIGQQIVFSQLNKNGSCKKDSWDGYRQNRERVLNHLHDDKISNTVILAGDSHANWVSDLARSYNPSTGVGALGVEFAGTAVTSGSNFGTGITPAAADAISRALVGGDANPDLQWSEGSFRGFFTLTIDADMLNATYFGMNNISFPNHDGFIMAQFIVKPGENRLSRPVAGGSVQAGALKSQQN
ncbi:PhoD-like phosphatase-domain-containing protein [Infundibulicybe gibba]|nr:PhoD-like phosphatase-domain-containing protein [Infundibulicybe gibba]